MLGVPPRLYYKLCTDTYHKDSFRTGTEPHEDIETGFIGIMSLINHVIPKSIQKSAQVVQKVNYSIRDGAKVVECMNCVTLH